MGIRTQLAERADQLIAERRVEMLERVTTPEMLQLFFDALKARLTPGERCSECGQEALPKRDAVQLMAQILKLVEAAPQVQVAIANFLNVKLDVRDETEAVELVTAGRQMRKLRDDSATTHADFRESAVLLLSSLYIEHPDWRGVDLLRLGAVPAERNGHA